jgi:hypothetical protein
MVESPSRASPLIQSRRVRSQGQRSSSVRGVPEAILSLLACGWKASASAYGIPVRALRSSATVVFPLALTPMMMT